MQVGRCGDAVLRLVDVVAPALAGTVVGTHPRELGGELQQRERVASGLVHEAVQDLGARRAESLLQQLPGSLGVKTRERELGDALRIEGPLIACREDQRHAIRAEPARTEEQRCCRGGVEPVRVVHDAQHRILLGG